jgi:hypothetical protein
VLEHPQCGGVPNEHDLLSIALGSELLQEAPHPHRMDLEHWRCTRTVAIPTYESELQTTAYFGTPAYLVQRIRQLQEMHQVQYFGASMSFGTMQHADVMRSMELFAREVMPKFR